MRTVAETPHMSKTAVWAIGLGLLLGGSAVVVFLFDPARTAIYPVCYFHKLTGWHCPGCGSLRALHQLTHGELVAAFSCNPLLIASLPVLAWMGLRPLIRKGGHPALFSRPIKLAAPWVALGVIVLFGILRNLPFPACAWMAP